MAIAIPIDQPQPAKDCSTARSIQLPAQKLLMQGDGEATSGDCCSCITADVFAGVSQKVRITQMLQMGFQFAIDLCHRGEGRFH